MWGLYSLVLQDRNSIDWQFVIHKDSKLLLQMLTSYTSFCNHTQSTQHFSILNLIWWSASDLSK